jgi:hypothetical protein
MLPLLVLSLHGEDFTYTTNNGAIAITGYIGLGGAVTIPGTITGLPVTGIDNWAFNNSSVTTVSIPRSVTSIGVIAFIGCSSLTAITVDSLNPSYSSLDGVLFNRSRTTLIACPGGKIGTYSIPNTVSSIAANGFYHCSRLTSVTIPNSVTSIGMYGFFNCTSLTNITIPDSVTTINNAAFAYCSNLTSVTIGNHVTSLSDRLFAECRNLIRVTIPNSVTNIGWGAFELCTSLSNVFFLGNAPALGSSVFSGAANATVYCLPGTAGWGPTFGGRPTMLWNPKIQTAAGTFGMGTNGFGFTITGTTNIPIAVEASTTLTSGSWITLQTYFLTNGSLYFSDPLWSNYPGRFYRLRAP